MARPAADRARLAFGLGLTLLAVVAGLALALGPYAIPLVQLPGLVLGQPGGDATAATVLWELRLPRVLLGLACGAGLGLSGAALQGLFRNPLADPGLIGVSSGAALGAAAATLAPAALLLPGTPLLHGALAGLAQPLAAFAGGLLAVAAVQAVAARGGGAPAATLLLAGIAVNALAGAGLGLASFLADDAQLRGLTFWNLGSLAGAGGAALAPAVLLALAGGVALLRQRHALNLLLLGEREAGHLGVAVGALRRRVVAAAALTVGALVSVSGVIGFIGLVAPHLARLLLGPDHRYVLPGAALTGALLLLAADLAARLMVAPAELPVGVLTALIGAPLFLHLIVQDRRGDRG